MDSIRKVQTLSFSKPKFRFFKWKMSFEIVQEDQPSNDLFFKWNKQA